MPTQHNRDTVHTLKTATSAADPALIRITTPDQHILLLAQDATYDRAHALRLHNVQWSSHRRGLFQPRRPLANGSTDHLHVRLSPDHLWLALPDQPTFRVARRPRTWHFRNLSRPQYDAFTTASPRRLLIATTITPPHLPVTRTLLAFHRLRFAARNLLLPASR